MCNDIVLITLNDVYLNIVLARKYHFRARNYLCCQVEVSFRKWLLCEVWGLGAEGFEEKNGFDDVIKLLVYARGE